MLKRLQQFYSSAFNSKRTYVFALILAMLICLFLNWNSDQMSGILANYEDFADYFKSGFDASTPFSRGGRFTFPMWGYAAMLMLGLPKWALMALQLGGNVLLLSWIDRILPRLGFSEKGKTAYRWLSVLAFPWHLIHANLWPYSEGGLLLIAGLVQAMLFLKEWKAYQPLLAGIFFGLALNFRSDYYFFAWVLFGTLAISSFIRNRKALLPSLGFGSFAVLLLPWVMYTHMRTGHYLTTSTNAGHVFYIGLGQLPNNPWHISPVDEDPNMHGILDSVLGKGSSSLDYEGDQLLKKAWADSVKAKPIEYLKKCGYVSGKIVLRPFNAGSMNSTEETAAPIKLIRKLATYKVALLGVLFFYFSIFYLFKLLKHEKLSLLKSWKLIPLLAIGYQLALVICAFFMPSYHTNTYLLYLLLAIAGMEIQHQNHSKKSMSNE